MCQTLPDLILDTRRANGEPAFSRHVLTRDIPLMTALSLSILFFGVNWKHPGRPL